MAVFPEIEFPELLPQAHCKPDIRIYHKSLSSMISGKERTESFCWPSVDHFMLNIIGVGTYLVRDGSIIEVDPVKHCEIATLRIFLLGTCMGVILHQRGVLPVHASGIST